MASVKTMFICAGLYVATVFFSVNPALAAGNNETTWHYFSNVSVSMYETPWVDGQKTFQIYSWQGEPVYKMENVLHIPIHCVLHI